MSAPDHSPDENAALPDSLHQQLRSFRRHLWRLKAFEAIAAGLVGLLVSFLLVYGLDRIWPTPAWARLAILIGGTSLFALFAPFWLHRWIWRHRREEQLARLIARRFPGLGDRLLGVIELQSQHESADSLSPRLRAAAMAAVAAEAGKRSLKDALPPPRHRKWGLALLTLTAGTTAVLTLTPNAGLNALKRWLLPLSNTERYTFTKLDNPPTYLAVPFGEAFDVTLHLAKSTEQSPTTASGRYSLQPPVTSQLTSQSYHFTFPGQQEKGTILFRVGDALHELQVEPLQRPFVESVNATITPPPYLQIPPQTVDLSNGVLNAVEGSQVRIAIQTNRPLAEASYGPTKALVVEAESPTNPDPADPQTPESATPEPEPTPEPAANPFTPLAGSFTHTDRTSSTPDLAVTRTSFEIPIQWRDRYGLNGEPGYRVRVDAATDSPPSAYLQGIERQKVMLPEETIDFETLAEDDFGIKAAGIEWSGEFSQPSNTPAAKGEMKLVENAPQQARATATAAFSPKAFGIEPQKITLRAFTEDYFPNRPRSYSEPVTIFVLTRDEHAQLLKSQFDRTIAELEDLARREENQFDETQRLDNLNGEELQSEENQKRLETQEQAEAENERRMEELTDRMEELMKNAARNGDIDKDTMKKMAEALKSMQELSETDIPKVQQELEQSLDPSNTPKKTDQDVQKAKEAQEKVVEKMKEAIDRANDANERMEAGTFVNRLKKAASEEEAIATSLIEAFNNLLGTPANEVDPKDQRRLKEANRQQTNTAADVQWIQEDLGHYHARTNKAPFKEVLDEMRQSEISPGLEQIRTRLTENHSFLATENAKKWATKLTEWAKKLEGEMQENPSGEGGEGASSPEDEDFEFMLRVLKMVQKQQDLRARTRALEQLRRSNPANPQPAPNP